jgi:tRNA 2-thiouridine synthesizing protein A
MARLYKKGERLYVLDVRGYTCPYPVIFTRKALSKIEPGSTLEVVIDNPPSCETVPDAARSEGHEVLSVEQRGSGEWVIRIRKRG